jgi:hypothetical protein
MVAAAHDRGGRHADSRRRLTAACLAALALAPLVGGCGDDDGGGAQVGNPARYCALTAELDALGESIFGALPRTAGPEEFAVAERELVRRAGERLEELERVAPEEIRADVPALVEGLRARAGIQDAEVGEEEAAAVERRIQAHEERACAAGPDPRDPKAESP